MKKNVLLSILLILSFSLNAKTKVGLIKGMSSIPFAFMVQDFETDENYQIEFKWFKNSIEAAKALYDGKIDALNLPLKASEKLYSISNGKIKCACVTEKSCYYVVSINNSIKTLSDLLGKKVYISGEGQKKDVFLELLKVNGIPVSKNEGGINVISEVSDELIMKELILKNYGNAVFSEPSYSVSIRNKNKIYKAIDLQDEISQLYDGDFYIPSMLLMVHEDYVKGNSEEFLFFLDKLKHSIEDVNNFPGKAALINKKHSLGINDAVSFSAIVNGNFCYDDSEDFIKYLHKACEISNISVSEDFFISRN